MMQAASASFREAPPAPGPPGIPWLGHVHMLRDVLPAFERLAAQYGPVARLTFAGAPYIVLSSAEGAHHVLVEHWERYPKSPSYDGLRLFLGNGLVTSEGEHWRKQRKLIQPGFHRARLVGFVDTMVDATDRMLVDWERRLREDPTIDVHEEMTRLTFRIVGRTLFGIDLVDDAAEIGRTVAEAQEAANEFALRLVRIPASWPTPFNRKVAALNAANDAVVYRIVEERRRDRRTHRDLLAMLLDARDEETREGMDDRQLRDEIVTLIAAGHETTSNALAWTFYHLGRNPEIARRLVDETRAAIGDRAPTHEDLPALDYARRVVEEAMRLHPPVTGIERIAAEDDVIEGCGVPKGALVGIMMWNIHRNPAYWPEPERFDPDRFLPEQVAARPKHAYMPFGAGPRICIGNTFATIEATVLLARISQRFRLLLDPKHPVVPQSLVTLRPEHGIRVKLAPI